MKSPATWQIRIDTGGTFTDCWALPPGESIPRLVKVLSSGRLRVAVSECLDSHRLRIDTPANWQTPPNFFRGFETSFGDVVSSERAELTFAAPIETSPKSLELYTGEEAPVIGARLLTGTALNAAFPPIDLRLATTRGTNALLEQRGAPIHFFVTSGFRDLLKIRDQRRPDLFALNHRKPEQLYEQAIEIEGRLSAQGTEITPLSLPDLPESTVRIAAVALLHSYQNPAHELKLKEHLLANGYTHVSLSSDLAPLIKLLPRAETAMVDAYLTPVMQSFIDHVEAKTDSVMLTMTSAGGLEPASTFCPKDSLLSGPAGGIVGARASALEAGFENVLTFDMGGTSTDVARIDSGDFHYRSEQKVGPATLLAPSLKIETVAAGGGSICYYDVGSSQLRVGPESAGADPGPACYGRGGPLTVTDVNLLLGRIDPTNFGIPLSQDDFNAATRAALDLQQRATGESDELDLAFLEGLHEIATEQMADAIRTVSIRDGADPSDYALLGFGGAGGLHACAIAERLSIDTVIVPAEAGVLSAYGLHHARIERIAERQILSAPDDETLPGLLIELEQEARSQLSTETPEIRRRIADVRLLGQDSFLALDFNLIEELPTLFSSEFARVFGYQPDPNRTIEVVSIRVIASEGAEIAPVPCSLGELTEVHSDKAYIDRSTLSSGATLTGPIVIQDSFSTTWLPTGWKAEVRPNGTLILRSLARSGNLAETRAPAAITQELFRHRFTRIVSEMGALLERTAISTNVKERLDFSCALLDAEGQLVANAPHIPVHLGALGLCVREVVKTVDLAPGDVIVTNHPAFGGSHLPDVTLISPAYDPKSGNLIGYLANRAHHAEIGGISPGSMPPSARNLEEEGVVIPPTHLFRSGKADYEAIEKLLTAATFPTRRLADNLADLHAQAAANQRGVAGLIALVSAHGAKTVSRELDGLAKLSAEVIRERISKHSFSEEQRVAHHLDDGTIIAISASVIGDGRLKLDFSGTSSSHPGNLNATPAIVRSAVLYVLRLWSESDLPLNEGLLADIDITLPNCFLNPTFSADPSECPAVVGGNVETSQRIVEALIDLFDIQAASQGTMNNLIFGNKSFGYYETICGGAGAGPGYNGADALHTHMTNTSITDPEILELRYPVRLHEFSIRPRPATKAQFQGGAGVVRELEFLAPLTVSMITQHRTEGPPGKNSAPSGLPGSQSLNGAKLPGITSFEVKTGDRLKIETPNGGSWNNA